MMRLEAGEDEVLERVVLVPTSRASVLLPLSFRKFLLIQLLMSWRHMFTSECINVRNQGSLPLLSNTSRDTIYRKGGKSLQKESYGYRDRISDVSPNDLRPKQVR